MQDYNYKENTHLEPGEYTISAFNSKCYTNTFSVSAAIKYNNKNSNINVNDYNSAVKHFTISENITDAYWVAADIVVTAGYSTTGETVYPMMSKRYASGEYEPYTGGKPSPSFEYPQSMNFLSPEGNMTIETTDGTDEKRQSFIVETSAGLLGIPVSEGGNYTDENGQQWICDEVDIEKNLYIKRIEKYLFSERDTQELEFNVEKGYIHSMVSADKLGFVPLASGGLWAVGRYAVGFAFDTFFVGADGNLYITTDTDVPRYNGTEMMLARTEPLLLPLSAHGEAEKLLQMYKPATYITNDAGAHMKVEYTIDTKTYIDNKIADLEKAILSAAT
jgi:hypothetical protein